MALLCWLHSSYYIIYIFTGKSFQLRTTFEILNADFPDQISLDARLVDSVSQSVTVDVDEEIRS